MKRVVLVVLGGYLFLAVGNKVAEAAGVMRCGCAEHSWCKRPGLNLFRPPRQPRMTSPKRVDSAFVQFRFIEHHMPDGIASALVVLFRARVAERMLKVGVQHL